ncbi:hypothetical protein [Rhodopila sp.]|jgi:hypothetical protein|uniref:hypothetical protein n=1 Tax=Rhodopila sp. TaxID=2480087 RepID=UPI002C89D5D8|nr:hypothetical protein [Rhodopila sp.]HVZ10007.1 hypothetical protein [Rhodopila sp.]
MNLLATIASVSVPAFMALLFLTQLATKEFGLWLGRRQRRNKVQLEGVGVVVGGMMGLLAFVLALTLSFANGRFEERRSAVFQEGDAIGGAHTRAMAMGDPDSVAIAHLLEDYLNVRQAFVEAPHGAAQIDDLIRRSAVLENEIWTHLGTMMRERPNPVTVGLVNSVDQAFAAAARVRFSYATRIPPQVLWLLIGSSLCTMGGLGYQLGLRGQTLRILSTALMAMWTLVIVDVLDLSSSRLGRVRTDTAIYGWVRDGFAAPPKPPPSQP